MKWILCILSGLIIISNVLAQDLFSERIRKINCSKKSVFLKKGIIYSPGEKKPVKLKALRHSFSKRKGYERIVFDFTSREIPRVYGYMDSDSKKIYLDLFNTDLRPGIKSFGKSKFVKDVKIFPVSEEMLSIEFDFKKKVEFDVFCLKSHGRLVIDVK